MSTRSHDSKRWVHSLTVLSNIWTQAHTLISSSVASARVSEYFIDTVTIAKKNPNSSTIRWPTRRVSRSRSGSHYYLRWTSSKIDSGPPLPRRIRSLEIELRKPKGLLNGVLESSGTLNVRGRWIFLSATSERKSARRIPMRCHPSRERGNDRRAFQLLARLSSLPKGKLTRDELFEENALAGARIILEASPDA